MKITKKVSIKASDICPCPSNHKDNAVRLIKSAMGELALASEDDICIDSIANLSVVLFDLCPEEDTTEETIEIPDDMQVISEGNIVD